MFSVECYTCRSSVMTHTHTPRHTHLHSGHWWEASGIVKAARRLLFLPFLHKCHTCVLVPHVAGASMWVCVCDFGLSFLVFWVVGNVCDKSGNSDNRQQTTTTTTTNFRGCWRQRDDDDDDDDNCCSCGSPPSSLFPSYHPASGPANPAYLNDKALVTQVAKKKKEDNTDKILKTDFFKKNL